MNKYKVALFDVDGVLIITPKLFSTQYCELYDVDPNILQQFYATKEFKDTIVGKYDLIDALRIHNDMWQWDGEPQELLKMWFEGESNPNQGLLKVIRNLREKGMYVYLTTQQEKYRKQYLMEQTFKDEFDGIFCSSDIGFNKYQEYFWLTVLDQIAMIRTNTKPQEIVYFDDKQNLVNIAKKFGVDAFVYKDVAQVRNIVAA